MNAYEIKKQAKIERLTRAAELCDREADRMAKTAKQMADVIPFGQPILVGHHSESRDRNYRARIQRRWEKGNELRQKAEDYRRRAANAASSRIVSSDDPDAIDKLKDRVAKLEVLQGKMKQANAALRKKDLKSLAEMGFTEIQIQQLGTPDFCGRIGFADYQLTNNSSNIRRLKLRIKQLESRSGDITKETEKNGVRIVDNVEDNRLQLFFPGKPIPGVIKELKSSGFRWTPTVQCWQRFRSDYALARVLRTLDLLEKKEIFYATAC